MNLTLQIHQHFFAPFLDFCFFFFFSPKVFNRCYEKDRLIGKLIYAKGLKVENKLIFMREQKEKLVKGDSVYKSSHRNTFSRKTADLVLLDSLLIRPLLTSSLGRQYYIQSGMIFPDWKLLSTWAVHNKGEKVERARGNCILCSIQFNIHFRMGEKAKSHYWLRRESFVIGKTSML